MGFEHASAANPMFDFDGPTRWDEPDSDPVADIEEVLAKGFAEGLSPSPTLYFVPPGVFADAS